MYLAGIDGEVKSFDDLLVVDRNPKVLDLKQRLITVNYLFRIC